MGVLGALQKKTEKTVLSRGVDVKHVGKTVGSYHFYISVWTSVAIILAGYLVDFLTIGSLFYIASILYGIAGLMI